MSEPTLYDRLIGAVRDAFPDVQMIMDSKQSRENGRNLILKCDGKTIGYINGRTKFRIDSPRLDRKVLITHPAQIDVAVEFLQTYLPREGAAT